MKGSLNFFWSDPCDVTNKSIDGAGTLHPSTVINSRGTVITLPEPLTQTLRINESKLCTPLGFRISTDVKK